jgi:hypothetical protein
MAAFEASRGKKQTFSADPIAPKVVMAICHNSMVIRRSGASSVPKEWDFRFTRHTVRSYTSAL